MSIILLAKIRKATSAALILATALTLFTQCGKQQPELSIALDQDAVTIKADKPATVTYTATGYASEITVGLTGADPSVSARNSFNGTTGKGEIILSTTSSSSSANNTILVFSDGTSTVEKNLSIKISSSWSVEPDNPTEQ